MCIFISGLKGLSYVDEILMCDFHFLMCDFVQYFHVPLCFSILDSDLGSLSFFNSRGYKLP